MAQLRLFHNNKNLRNLGQFAEFYNISITDKFTIEDFFNYNRQYIFDQLSITQTVALMKKLGKAELKPEDLEVNMELPCPCFLYIEQKYITYNLHVKNNNFQIQQTNIIAFQNEEIQKILQDPLATIDKTYKKTIPGVRVMGWFKALHYYEKEKQTSNDIDNIYSSANNFIDLSPYVVSLTTTVNGSGGNFSLNLPHVPLYTKFVKGDAEPSILNTSGDVNAYSGGGSAEDAIINPNQGKQFLSEDEKSLYVKSSIFQQDYFNWLIQANDLLFISFNAMDDVKTDELANHTWDMIALVNSVGMTKDANGNYSVSVSGRDLMKLITDDSRIFFPNSTSSGGTSIFDNTETVLKGGDLGGVYEVNKKGNKNVFGDLPLPNGTMPVFAMEPNDFSIDFVIKAVISKLANMRIVPDFLFTSWGEKRTKFTDLKAIAEPTQEDTKTTI